MTTIPSLKLLVEIPSKEIQELEGKLPQTVPQHLYHLPSTRVLFSGPDLFYRKVSFLQGGSAPHKCRGYFPAQRKMHQSYHFEEFI